MRLLKRNDDGELGLTADLSGEDHPSYAILSHTWGSTHEEVSYEDLKNGTGKRKPGYKKLEFCGEQAAHDKINYFWVDTCCIDKTNRVELSNAIKSMFKWYHDAVKCYVYLSDVRIPIVNANKGLDEQPWESAFRNSRWFRRGWTLQELIAPVIVEFFSEDRQKIGSKISLQQQIREMTGIHDRALQGAPLSEFSIVDRLAWAANRETTYEEDMVYSLLGMFNVLLEPCYGEGRDSAFRRLNEQIENDLKSPRFNDFLISFSLFDGSEAQAFVAREIELIEMHKALRGDDSRRAVTLHGLGGIGKTQLAVAYAKRYRHSYSAIFWLNAKDETFLKLSFIEVGKRIVREHSSASRLSGINMDEDLDKVASVVKEWFSLPGNSRWLMVYDNYDNPKLPGVTDPMAFDVRRFLPEAYQGSVIITTRLAEVRIGQRMRVGKLQNMNDSLKILSTSSRRKNTVDDPNAALLALELDGLPLALATAGSYLDQVPACSFSDYLRLYRASWARLQKSSPAPELYEDRTLYSTWQISFDQVKQQNKVSAKLLQLWAYFDNQDLWFELLKHSKATDPEWIRELADDEINFNNVVRVLHNYGLIDLDTTPQEPMESIGYSMHSCLHSWISYALNPEWNNDLAKLALKFVGSHIPERHTDRWWLTQRRLLQHAARCRSVLIKTKDGMEWAIHSLGRLYFEQGMLDDAEQMFQLALQGCTKSLETLGLTNDLGMLYCTQGRTDEAEQMLVRALAGYEKARGLDHTLTLTTVHNLGLLYSRQDRMEKAEETYMRALVGFEKAYGLDHLKTLRTVNNLGLIYRSQDKTDKAEEMLMRALAGYEKALGMNDASTLALVNNLGLLYSDQGNIKKAEQMYKQALAGKEKVWGPDHRSTLETANNLGLLYWEQGKMVQAEQMLMRTLAGREKALGADHISTLEAVNNLGLVYRDQDRMDEAEQMLVRALNGKQKARGPDNTSTLITVNILGALYRDQGRMDDAEHLLLRALAGYEKARCLYHKSTLDTANNLGLHYRYQGRIVEAEQMLIRALAGKEKLFGLDHTSTLDAVSKLGLLYCGQGRMEEASQLLTRALTGYEKALGPGHMSTLGVANNLGSLYSAQGKTEEAEQTYVRALAGYRNARDDDHPYAKLILQNLERLKKARSS